MPEFKKIYDDKRFNKVSAETKTDIISAIGFDISSAEDDVKESKFTKEILTEALHYLIAKTARQNANVRAIIRQDSSSTSSSVSSSYSYDPFYFGNRDPLLWYALGYHSGYSHGSSSMPMGGGGGSSNNDCNGETLAIACGIACVCSAGVCCTLCTKATLDGPESDNVKTAKVSASVVTAIAVFTLMIYLLNKNDVWHQDLVENQNWDEGGYRFFLFLVSAFGGLFSGGVVSTANNIFQCLPQPEDEIPKPSAEVLEAVKDLAVIEELLTKGWKREGDDVEQCNAFIREVVTMYIATIAARPIGSV
ncbi:MAG: hypothetical protein P4M12_05600 [Gammaproteobacteria bacterium]|nr:hypothetical protein [Gammaproteobacteria bacterium]